MRFDNEAMKKLREDKGLSKDDLAAKMGVSRVSISQWENGTNTPRLIHIDALGVALGVPGKYFID